MKGVVINIIDLAEPKIPEDRPPHMNGRDFLLVEVTKPTLNVCSAIPWAEGSLEWQAEDAEQCEHEHSSLSAA